MARLNAENSERARRVIARYPQRRSALLPLLHLAQEQDGWLTKEAMEHVAQLLNLTPAEVLGTASFYTMYKREPVGRHLVSICTNIACMLDGAYDLLQHAEDSLETKSGHTTDDGAFSLEEVECLALCDQAPCIQVNYRFFGNVTPERLDELCDGLRAGRLDADVPSHGTLVRSAPASTSWDAAGGPTEERA